MPRYNETFVRRLHRPLTSPNASYEDTLSTLSQRLIEAHEEERTRLARSFTTTLSAVGHALLGLEVVKQRVEVPMSYWDRDRKGYRDGHDARVMCRIFPPSSTPPS